MNRFGGDAGAAWWPGAAERDRSRLQALLTRVGESQLEDFHERAVRDSEWYWREVVGDLGLVFDCPFEHVRDPSSAAKFPRWFTRARMNATASCLDRWQDEPDRIALVATDEAGHSRTVSYGGLYAQTVALAGFLRQIGVAPGDPVALMFPMIPEAVVALMACARVGAIGIPVYSGYGPDAIAGRLRACMARVLLMADGFTRKGSEVDLTRVVQAALADAPDIERVVIADHLGQPARVFQAPGLTLWDEAIAAGSASDGSCELLDPNAPLLIVLTSGTSGAPKGIVLSHGGFLVKATHDFAYLFDVQDDDVVLWPSDMGWLMAPIMMVGTLALRAQLVLLEGMPGYPTAGDYWALVESHGVTVLGTSPTATRSLMRAGDHWLDGRDLSSLRAFASVGEPWDPESWEWLFSSVGDRRLPILNYCGGTEISGGIVACYTIAPIAPCAFSGPVIGLDADVVDPSGRSIRGQSGELVLRGLTPGVTHSFWPDDDQRYLDTYWSQIDGLWVQGDQAIVDENGYWHVTGRSDDTIKVAGRRIGPAEIEAVVTAHDAVKDASIIGIPDALKGSAIICFVVEVDGATQNSDLLREIRASIIERLGRTLVPDAFHIVDALPRTRSGKLVRRAIRSRYLGLPLGDLSGLENPLALAGIPLRSTGDEPAAVTAGLGVSNGQTG